LFRDQASPTRLLLQHVRNCAFRNHFLYREYSFNANSDTSVYELTRSSANFGPVAVKSTGTATVNVEFNAAVTPTSVTFSSNSVFSSTGEPVRRTLPTQPVRPAPSMLNSLLQPRGLRRRNYVIRCRKQHPSHHLSRRHRTWRRHHPRSRHGDQS